MIEVSFECGLTAHSSKLTIYFSGRSPICRIGCGEEGSSLGATPLVERVTVWGPLCKSIQA